MHRFYMVHSFRTFHRVNVSTAALFLAAKVEEQPRKLEHMAKVFHSLHNREGSELDVSSPEYTKIVEDITYHELLLLETLGFEVQVEHPHQHVVKCTRLVRASKDLSQTAYFMTHNSLLLTTFCLEHRPTVVACVCIHLAATWKGEDFTNLSSQNSNWWEYVDPSVTQEQLDDLTKEFLKIYEKCPSRLQKKVTEPMKVQHHKQKPGCSSSSSSGASSSVPSHHHRAPLPQQSSKQSDQTNSTPTVKHKPPLCNKDQTGQQSSLSSSQGRSHSHHAHGHGHGHPQPHGVKQQPPPPPPPPPSGHGKTSSHKLHPSHNQPPHPHHSKSGSGSSVTMVSGSSSQSQHPLHANLPSLMSIPTKSHPAYHTDVGRHLSTSALSSGTSSTGGKHLLYHLQQQSIGSSGSHGVRSGAELQNALPGTGYSTNVKHHHQLQHAGVHNPNLDVTKHRHHKQLHGRPSDPHSHSINHSYDQQRGVKRPHSEETHDRKRLKFDQTASGSSISLPSLPPLPPLPAEPPPPPPPSTGSSGNPSTLSMANAILPPLPEIGVETVRLPPLPPLPPPLPLSNPDESPPPPPPPPNH